MVPMIKGSVSAVVLEGIAIDLIASIPVSSNESPSLARQGIVCRYPRVGFRQFREIGESFVGWSKYFIQ